MNSEDFILLFEQHEKFTQRILHEMNRSKGWEDLVLREVLVKIRKFLYYQCVHFTEPFLKGTLTDYLAKKLAYIMSGNTDFFIIEMFSSLFKVLIIFEIFHKTIKFLVEGCARNSFWAAFHIWLWFLFHGLLIFWFQGLQYPFDCISNCFVLIIIDHVLDIIDELSNCLTCEIVKKSCVNLYATFWNI